MVIHPMNVTYDPSQVSNGHAMVTDLLADIARADHKAPVANSVTGVHTVVSCNKIVREWTEMLLAAISIFFIDLEDKTM